MDWSDDLTYAIHDAEDFFRAGLIPLHLLKRPEKAGGIDKQRLRFLEYVYSRKDRIPELRNVPNEEIDGILQEILYPAFNLDEPYEGTRANRAWLRIFTSFMVNRYINALHLVDEGSGVIGVKTEENHKKEIAILKQLTWCFVIEAPSLAVQQSAQKKIIEFLFDVFMEEAGKGPSHLLPTYYQQRLSAITETGLNRYFETRRMVADMIAGMTEAQAVAIYQRLHGMVSGSAFEKILV